MKTYNKLVRDLVPSYIAGKGEEVKYHVADDEEYWAKLKEKLREEVEELLQAENIEELADVLEVLDAITVYKDFDVEEVARVKEEKNDFKGGFLERIILDEAE